MPDARFGVIFPTTEFGDDPALLRRFAAAATDAGLDYIVIYDHVVGAGPAPGGPARTRSTTRSTSPS